MLRAWDPKVESFWRTRSRRAELCQVRWWSLHPEGGGPLRPEHWRVFTEGAESVHQLHSKWVEVVLALCRKWASIVAAVDFEVWEFIINWCHSFLHTLHGYFVSSHKCDFPENELLVAALDFEVMRVHRQMMSFFSTYSLRVFCVIAKVWLFRTMKLLCISIWWMLSYIRLYMCGEQMSAPWSLELGGERMTFAVLEPDDWKSKQKEITLDHHLRPTRKLMWSISVTSM